MKVCPKCRHQQAEGLEECQRCGVIFSRIPDASVPPPSRQRRRLAAPSALPAWLDHVLIVDETQPSDAIFWFKVLVWLGMIVWGIQFMAASIDRNEAGQSVLHLVNLPFHEAGHVLFRPFGEFMTSLGGTLGQLLMPLICCGYFLIKTRDAFAAAVAFWWFAQNFFDIAPYINDARSGTLPLLGGNFGHSSPYGFHDWEYLLTETGLLQYDHTLAWLSTVTGSLLMLLSIAWGGAVLFRLYRA